MFSFLSMMDNYEQRKVDNFRQGDLTVDTCAVCDSAQPYETAIEHPAYNDGYWVVVELYNSKEEAQIGHDKWVKIMTADVLPNQLADVSSSEVAQLSDLFGDDWRDMKKGDECTSS